MKDKTQRFGCLIAKPMNQWIEEALQEEKAHEEFANNRTVQDIRLDIEYLISSINYDLKDGVDSMEILHRVAHELRQIESNKYVRIPND